MSWGIWGVLKLGENLDWWRKMQGERAARERRVLSDSLHNCGLFVMWQHRKRQGEYTLTYGERVPASLSAASTPIANEMTSITQWSTKPVGYCLHFWCTVSHKRSASWAGGRAFWTVAFLLCFPSVIIITACSGSAGKQPWGWKEHCVYTSMPLWITIEWLGKKRTISQQLFSLYFTHKMLNNEILYEVFALKMDPSVFFVFFFSKRNLQRWLASDLVLTAAMEVVLSSTEPWFHQTGVLSTWT